MNGFLVEGHNSVGITLKKWETLRTRENKRENKISVTYT